MGNLRKVFLTLRFPLAIRPILILGRQTTGAGIGGRIHYRSPIPPIPEDELFTFFVEGAYKRLVSGETWTQFVFGGDEPFETKPILDDNHTYL